MELDISLRKAEHLLNQDRFGEAQTEIKNYLASKPEDVNGLMILAQTHMGLGQDEMADLVVDDILKIEASNPEILYIKGVTQARLGQRKSALKFLDSALGLNPLIVEAYAAKAVLHFEEAKFEEALNDANAGLQIDPENDTCLNQRSRALLRLGRKEQHVEAEKQALKNNPMNPNTHATVGLGELEKGNTKKAKEHFREALKLDPNNDFARSGMVHAIKSTNLYYRLFLRYVFWMQGLKPQVRWAVVIIGYLLIRGLNTYSNELGSFSILAESVIILYVTFAVSTWIMTPVSNIFLRFHSYGKYLLNESQIKNTNISTAFLTVSLLGAVMLITMSDTLQWYNLGFYMCCTGIAMTVVMSSIENASLEKSKRNLKKAGIVFGIACAIVIISGIILPGLAFKIFNWLIYGFLGFQFYANSQR